MCSFVYYMYKKRADKIGNPISNFVGPNNAT